MRTQRWTQIATRASSCSAVPSGMVKELLDYTESLRMAVESGYREGFRDGAGCSFCTEEEERETEDACWRDSKANEAIHPDEG